MNPLITVIIVDLIINYEIKNKNLTISFDFLTCKKP